MNFPYSVKAKSERPALSKRARVTLRREVESLRTCTDKDTALDSLDRIAAAIDMPMMAWAPDVAQPYYSPEMDAFIRRQGWPDDIVRLWRENSAALKIPFYARCRFTHLPFITSLVASPKRTRRSKPTREERLAEQISRRLGLRSLLTVPVHLPRGQVAMLTWAGPRSPASASALLDEACVELLAAAHFTMRVLHRADQQKSNAPEITVRLTPREWDCLRLTAQGFREADVARLMHIGQTTVRYHVDNVVEKLGAGNRTHAVAIAAQLGLLGPIGA